MLKSILNLEGMKILKKDEQTSFIGGSGIFEGPRNGVCGSGECLTSSGICQRIVTMLFDDCV